MIQTVSIKAFIRDKGGWNGKTDRVYIRVLVGSRKKVYSTGVSGAKKNFDNGAGEFRARSADGQKNNKLVEIRSAMLRIVKTLELTRPDFTIHDFHAAYTAVQNKTETVLLVPFVKQEIELRKKSVSVSTTKHDYSLVEHLTGFRAGATINQVTYDYLSRFYSYLRSLTHHDDNTVYIIGANTAYGYLKRLRIYIRIAINKGLMKNDDYPFRNFKIGSEKTNRGFLDETQVRSIINAVDFTRGMDAARRRFIFQCYTGLRFSELNNLRWHNIHGDMIILQQEKTGATVSIPLAEPARKIIERSTEPGPLEPVFTPITNQKYNEHLKEIQKKLKIPVHLTSHVARHTFATLALTYGISMETVSAMLGHTTIKTTQIYGRIVDMKKREEMKKFAL